MKFKAILLVSVSVATLALAGAMAVAQPNATAVRLPKKSSITCQVAIDNVRQNLITNGYFSTKERTGTMGKIPKSTITIDRTLTRRTYYNYPTDRPETIAIFLTGDPQKIFDNLANSPQKLAKIGANLMAECDRVGAVNFTAPWEEMVRIVGYFPDRSVRTFQRVDYQEPNDITKPGDRDILTTKGYKWGYYFSP